MATPVESALRRAVADLNALKAQWALIGGLAISVRSVPRFTKDLDFAVAVAGDSEAEEVVHRLGGRGDPQAGMVEQAALARVVLSRLSHHMGSPCSCATFLASSRTTPCGTNSESTSRVTRVAS